MLKTLLIIALTITGIGAVLAAELQTSVPQRFQGDWNADPQDCSADLSESQLLIAGAEIAFYESAGPIIAVVTRGDHEVALVSELSGEGENWLAYNLFRLSDDGMQLIDITENADFVRYRCP